ncbi:unnamed protein product [Ambrosiozyma monospora]|uniref:Unnamed protein product n=1 Tax=Ambrosiozyma monospora TaxID=43982 RepID=A0ACB5TJP9_AMBMO|nr:unnamed protein product [Ambrosiozyma monospora]
MQDKPFMVVSDSEAGFGFGAVRSNIIRGPGGSGGGSLVGAVRNGAFDVGKRTLGTGSSSGSGVVVGGRGRGHGRGHGRGRESGGGGNAHARHSSGYSLTGVIDEDGDFDDLSSIDSSESGSESDDGRGGMLMSFGAGSRRSGASIGSRAARGSSVVGGNTGSGSVIAGNADGGVRGGNRRSGDFGAIRFSSSSAAAFGSGSAGFSQALGSFTSSGSGSGISGGRSRGSGFSLMGKKKSTTLIINPSKSSVASNSNNLDASGERDVSVNDNDASAPGSNRGLVSSSSSTSFLNSQPRSVPVSGSRRSTTTVINPTLRLTTSGPPTTVPSTTATTTTTPTPKTPSSPLPQQSNSSSTSLDVYLSPQSHLSTPIRNVSPSSDHPRPHSSPHRAGSDAASPGRSRGSPTRSPVRSPRHVPPNPSASSVTISAGSSSIPLLAPPSAPISNAPNASNGTGSSSGRSLSPVRGGVSPRRLSPGLQPNFHRRQDSGVGAARPLSSHFVGVDISSSGVSSASLNRFGGSGVGSNADVIKPASSIVVDSMVFPINLDHQ